MRTVLPPTPRTAAPALPSPSRTAAARPPATAAPPDADLERARRFGHRFESADQIAPPPGGGEPAAPMPIQRMWPFGRKERSDSDASSIGEYGALLSAPQRQQNSPRNQLHTIQIVPDVDPQARSAISTPPVSDAQKLLSLASGVGSAAQSASRAAEFVKGKDIPSALGPGLGVAASPFAAGASALEGGTKLYQAATGGEKAEDKALLGLEATSSLANATVSGANTVRYASELLGRSTATAVSVAGPAAIAMGGADLVGGAVNSGLAAHRQKKLDAIMGDMRGGFDYGAARFARDSQQTKKMRHAGTALKGGLAIGGGIALLAGAGPVGWGLLGGAALVGGGLLAYKQYRKHKLGKEILEKDDAYREALTGRGGITMPDDHDLARDSLLKRATPFWNTKEARTHDLIRGQIALKLAEKVHQSGRAEAQSDDAHNSPLTAIVGLLGMRNKGQKKANAADIASALEG